MSGSDKELDELLRARHADAANRDADKKDAQRALEARGRDINAYMVEVVDDAVVQLKRELRSLGIVLKNPQPQITHDGATAHVFLARPGMPDLDLTLTVVHTGNGLTVTLDDDMGNLTPVPATFDDLGRSTLHDALMDAYKNSLRYK